MAEYIERDMLLKMISHKPSSPTTDREDRLIDGFISAVKNCPAANVRTVVRGKWEMNSNYPDRLICSECGAQFDCWHWEAKQMHYCPNCGAKMDGGQDDV